MFHPYMSTPRAKLCPIQYLRPALKRQGPFRLKEDALYADARTRR